MFEVVADLIGPARAARNAAAVLEKHRIAIAEIDSVVDRLERRVQTAA
jgi:hypothetical protein